MSELSDALHAIGDAVSGARVSNSAPTTYPGLAREVANLFHAAAVTLDTPPPEEPAGGNEVSVNLDALTPAQRSALVAAGVIKE